MERTLLWMSGTFSALKSMMLLDQIQPCCNNLRCPQILQQKAPCWVQWPWVIQVLTESSLAWKPNRKQSTFSALIWQMALFNTRQVSPKRLNCLVMTWEQFIKTKVLIVDTLWWPSTDRVIECLFTILQALQSQTSKWFWHLKWAGIFIFPILTLQWIVFSSLKRTIFA